MSTGDSGDEADCLLREKHSLCQTLKPKMLSVVGKQLAWQLCNDSVCHMSLTLNSDFSKSTSIAC